MGTPPDLSPGPRVGLLIASYASVAVGCLLLFVAGAMLGWAYEHFTRDPLVCPVQVGTR